MKRTMSAPGMGALVSFRLKPLPSRCGQAAKLGPGALAVGGFRHVEDAMRRAVLGGGVVAHGAFPFRFVRPRRSRSRAVRPHARTSDRGQKPVRAVAVMGKGPPFGFDGGARACRTTHKEAGAWPANENEEAPQRHRRLRTTNQSVTRAGAVRRERPSALVLDSAKGFHRRLRKAGQESHDRVTVAEAKTTPGIPLSVWHVEAIQSHELAFIRFGFFGSPY